ncbi:Acyl-CoA synthetase (AMP-forming)/AMP-acid ligase II [Halanaeroarchaeum sp. HSR-CO]|uniref:hypothetical protein n=1 Tax=Halanaeroarchaeum sp. HSR-CO TaxID=2866382 RepID=UPI00217F2100|nr:hypothetical protein [Halanaeroarchaeum sp. HSR-CO]UWG47396.1 Acyl-CoA synthetase (AMP-forming)/AMP-acid ligase II [Halanaeroarchaeum sp. HSR-CO]
MDTVGDLLDLPHPDEEPALRNGRRTYEYHRFRATAYKTGNYLRYNGVGQQATVSLLDDLAPEAIFGVLGTALLGGRIRFDPETDVEDTVLFGPTDELDGYDVAGGCKRIGYGAKPTDPSWAFFEREIWSENPFFPPTDVDGDATLVDGWTQTVALRAARNAAADLSPDDVVAIRGSLTDPSTLIGGVLAPLVVGATILLPEDGQEGTVVVGAEKGPEERVLDTPDAPPASE